MSAPPLTSTAAEPEARGMLGYELETPFLMDGSAPISSVPIAGGRFGRESATSYETESPFLTEYGVNGAGEDARAEAFADLIGELEDEDFEEAVTDLVNEAAALAEERFSFEAGDPVAERIEAERGIRDYFEPLALECEAMVDRMIQGVGTADLTAMSESELENFLDRFAPGVTSLPPTLDQFGGSFFKKLKTGVQGAVKLAKKGAALAQKLSPVHLILGKLKGLVRPLLERVLKFAINKLPVSLRPVASQLAKRFLSAATKSEAMEEEDEGEGETAAEDPAIIAHEVDTRIAGYTLEGEDFDRWTSGEDFATEQQEGGADTWRELQQERTRFARDVTQLEEGEDPAPVVERFVPAILAALRIGIKVIGRPKVVNYLAGLLTKLIGKYVGKAQALPLSRALVDTGMKLVSLETPGEPEMESGYTLASTLEDTVTRVAQEAPEAAWESETVLEAYVHEAFQEAASAHFPDGMIRPELHESAGTSGAWVPLPAATKSKHYKKYTRVLDVMVTPQMAATLKSFGDTPVQAILRDQLSLPAGKPVGARAHLYESVAGSTLPDIAMHEKSVRGLGSSRREAWSLIHPLTPEAAGILFKEPGLGRQVDPKFLADRNRITVGQRFYFLELAGARPRLVAGPRGMRRTARVSQTNLTLDFPKGELRISLYFSEAHAQALSTQLRARAPVGTILTALKTGISRRLGTLLSGVPTRSVRIIHEAVPVEQFRSPVIGGALKLIGRPLSGVLIKWLLEALKRELEQRADQFAGQFTRAAAADADGVTVAIVFRQPSFMAPLRKLLAGGSALAAATMGASFLRQAMGEYALVIHPGFVRSSRQAWQQPVSKT
jgi:hypothetical protein